MATSKVFSVSVPENLVPVVESIKQRKDGLSGWFQEKVKQDVDSNVSLESIESALKDINEKLTFVSQALLQLKGVPSAQNATVASKFDFEDGEDFSLR